MKYLLDTSVFLWALAFTRQIKSAGTRSPVEPPGSLQKRPMGDGSKPANGAAGNLISFIPFSPAQASPFLCASSVGRI